MALWPGQIEAAEFLLSGLEASERRIVNKAREIGISWLAVALLVHGYLFKDAFSALLLSRKETLVDDPTPSSLFGKARFIIAHLPRQLSPSRPPSKQEDHFLFLKNPDTGSFLAGESTSASAGRSGRYTVVLADEWAHVDKSKQQSVKLSLESVARSWWKVSTPNGRGDEFHVDWITAPERMKLQLDWQTDPRRTQRWFDGKLKENGGPLTWDERAQEYDCSFAAVSGQRIWRVDREAIGYHEDDIDEVTRKSSVVVSGMDFGSGPSWTTWIALLVEWQKEGFPLLRADYELVFERTRATDIAVDILAVLRERYGVQVWIVGDPAGRNKESDQSSWETNLQVAGLPVHCLPPDFNSHEMIDTTLLEVQQLVDQALFKINLDACPILATAMESWQYDLPSGIPLELISRETLKPRKDQWSHLGDALRYAAGAALRIPREGLDNLHEAAEAWPQEDFAGLGDVYNELLGGGMMG